MSMRYKGAILSPNEATSTLTSAGGIWTLRQQMQAQEQGEWPGNPYYWITTLETKYSQNNGGVAVDSSGNIYTCSSARGRGTGAEDKMLVAKFNAAGILQWQKMWMSSTTRDVPNGIAVDSLGSVYVCGYTDSASNSSDFVVIKYSSTGTLLWQTSLVTADTDYAFGIAVDSSFNVYVSGSYYEATGGINRSLLVKLSGVSGTVQFQRYTGDATYLAYNYAVATDGTNVYPVGFISGASGESLATVTKYNSSGTWQWGRRLGTIGTTDTSYGYGVDLDSSGNIYLVGETRLQGASSFDAFIAKYDTTGVVQWRQKLSSANTDKFTAIVVDTSGNSYVAGRTSSTTTDILIAKYDTSGNIQWQRTLSGAGVNQGYGIELDPSGNVCVIGGTSSTPSSVYSQILVKLTSDGSLTGTYGPFTYVASSLTASSWTAADGSNPANTGTATLTQTAILGSSLTADYIPTVIQI